LPHGRADMPHATDQPILITHEAGNQNNAECLICVDGALPEVDDTSRYERVCLMFDGHDTEAVSQARALWVSLKDAKKPAQYWSEESGKWEMKQQLNG